MCGIVGYVGRKKVVPVIIEGLRRLEYRGYDSAGIAVGGPKTALLEVCRAPGKLGNLEEVLREKPLEGTFGIGHTRWATHGRPTEENAHPHRDCSGRIVVVHNGIVENYLELKHELIGQLHRAGHEIIDFGADSLRQDDDYPDFVIPLGRAVAASQVSRRRPTPWPRASGRTYRSSR